MRAILFAMPDVIWGFDLVTRLPNLGLVSIAGNIDKNLCDVKVCDLVVAKGDIRKFVRDLIVSYKPDIVGLSCMTFQYPSAIELAELIKYIDEDILIAFGGYHPTIAYEEISSSEDGKRYIDFIIRGEGEATFNELIEAIQGLRKIEEVKGLSYKHNGVFKHNDPRMPLNPESINLPDRDARILKDGFHIFGRRADVIETSRGCTFNCKFCCITKMYGKTYRTFKIERVMCDIENLKKIGVKSIFIVDDNITINIKRFEEICDAILQYGYDDIHYFVQASVKGIAYKEELVKKMKKAGFKGVFIGIETIIEEDSKILNVQSKRGSFDSIKRAVKYLKDNSIITLGSFILGNPNDDESVFWKSLNVAKELKLDIPIFFLLTPYPGTEIRNELMERKLITNIDDWGNYNCFSPVIKTNYLSNEQIGLLHWKICESWFDNLSWLKYNRIKKHYPLYYLKMIFKTWPNHLFKSFLLKLRIRNERELWIKDITNESAIFSTKKRIKKSKVKIIEGR